MTVSVLTLNDSGMAEQMIVGIGDLAYLAKLKVCATQKPPVVNSAYRPNRIEAIKRRYMEMTPKQYPGDFNFRQKPGEPKDIYETRMRETNGTTEKFSWKPTTGKAFRSRIRGGVQFPQQRKPDIFK